MEHDDDAIAAAMLRLVAARGPGKTICPSEVAREIAGELARNADPESWRRLMVPVRRVAVRLHREGRLTIMRKGAPVADPDDFRGVYRLGPSDARET